MSDRPNYYRILDLAPSVQSWPAIEKRIEELTRLYNRVRTDAPKTQQREAEAFKILLDRPDEGIKVVMKDDNLRAAEANARHKELKKEETQLEAFLRMLKNKGAYTKSDVKQIAGLLSGYDEAKIEARIKKMGLVEGNSSAGKPKRKTPPVIADAEGQSIDADLMGLQLPSLYAFLGKDLNQRSSQAALDVAIESQKKVIGKLVRGTPEHKVRSALLGHVQKHFLNKSSREKYDNYLANRELRAIDTFIKVCGGEAKVITDDALNQILREARIPNVTVEAIREYIETWVERTKGWVLVTTSDKRIERLLTCGSCGMLAASEGQAKCRDCGQPLEVNCPICAHLVPTQDSCCSKCGCSTGDRPHVERLLTNARAHLKSLNYKEAQRLVEDVLKLWPGFSVAMELLQEVRNFVADHQKQVRELSELIRTRRLQTAQQSAEDLIRKGGTVDDLSQQRINRGLAAAQTACDQARRLVAVGKIDDALDKYIEALTQCADYSEARDAMRNHPPSPPRNLQTTVSDTYVRLTWNSGSSRRKADYIVCRKQGGVPTRVDDGKRIATVTTEQFDDTDAAIGTVWFYAVYSALGETTSAAAATSEAVLRTGRVIDLMATAIDGHAEVKWTNPAGCSMAELILHPGAHKPIQIRGSESVIRDLQNGRDYIVEVTALYPDPRNRGKFLRADGEQVRLSVTPRPTPVGDLTTKLRGRRVRMRWTPPTVGQIQIRAATHAPPEGMEGAIVDHTLVQSLGTIIPRIGTADAEIELPASGQMFLIPVTVSGTNAVIGKWVHVAHLPEVTDFQSRPLNDGNIELTWTWPKGIKTVGVFVRPIAENKSPPQWTSTPIAEVSVEAFRQNGNVWQIACSRSHAYEIRLAVKAPHGEFYSSGVSRIETLGNEARVRYHVFSRRFTLFSAVGRGIELVSENGDCRSLDDVVVVGLPDRVPTGIDDGEVVHEAKKIVFSKGRAELPLEIERLATSLYLRLFLKNPHRHPCLKLLPAPKEQLLLKRPQ